MSKLRSVNDGDWICADADCSNVNFAWRPKCNKCGKDKGKVEIFKKTGSEIGKKAAEKSGGLFSADDWHCPSCGNVNWARRTDCNICHAAKFGTVEPRTGLGGGYNERENVEYIERAESDDEFDDLGRRKKTRRQKSSDKEINNRNRGAKDKETKRNEYNEKEDSGEEMDLSKYVVVGRGPEEEEEEEDDDDDDDEDDDVDLSKYDFGDDSPVTEKPLETKPKDNVRPRPSSRSPARNNHHNSSSPRRRSRSSRSRSRSGDRRKYRSRSRDRSRSPVRKHRSYRSRSRSRSRDKGSSYGRSRRSRSRSRDRRQSRRSRSRSRERDRRRSARSRSRDRYR